MTYEPMPDAASGPRPSPPKWLKPTVDYGPLVAFLAVYWLFGFMQATAALMGATVIGLSLSLIIVRRIPIMPLVTAAVVGVFGGLTLWLHDETFYKMKPTIVQAVMAAVLFGGLVAGKPLLRPLLGSAWSMDHQGWMKLTLRFGIFFVLMAGLNEIIWRTQSTDFWVLFKVFGITGLTLLFAISQAPLMTRHMIDTQDEDAEDSGINERP